MGGVERLEVTVDGATLSYLTAGTGPSVLLLHGIPTGAELWRDVIERLAALGFCAMAPDLPGYGLTRLQPRSDHSLSAAATLMARWLEWRSEARVRVVGHDAGGAVAQILAVQHSDLVAALTLTNSIVEGSWPAPRVHVARLAARARLHRLSGRLRLTPNGYMRRQVRRAFADATSLDDAVLDRVVFDTKFTEPNGRAAFERHLLDLRARDTTEAAAGLRHLSCPTQLVWGLQDPFQPWDVAGRRLAGLLDDAAVTHLPACGHFTPLECPDDLVEALQAWWRDRNIT